MSWTEKLLYQFKPRIAASRDLPETVRGRLRNDHFVLVAKFENEETSFTFNVPYHITPHKLLDMVLTKKALTTNKRQDRASDYILKISGQDEYIFGDYPLIQFIYIQDMLSRDGVPTVVTQCVSNVKVFEDDDMLYAIGDDERKDFKQTSTCTLRKKTKYLSSWNIDDRFQITIKSIVGLNCDTNRAVEIGVQVGLFHGGISLCEAKKTTETKLSISTAIFNEKLSFDINVANIPRMARLCLVVYETTKSAKGGGNRGRRIKDANKVSFAPFFCFKVYFYYERKML